MWTRALALVALAPTVVAQTSVGVAGVDITPETAIRLSGYGSRTTETEAVEQRLCATGLALGADIPVVLIAVDNCGIPASVTDEVASRLGASRGLEREHLIVSATHTHSGPMLTGVLENLFGQDLTPGEKERIDLYTERLIDALVSVAEEALDSRASALLKFGKGRVNFGANRRTSGGPVDPDLDVLAAHAPTGELRAIVVNYACHCTTLGGGFDRHCGDWAGYAREALEREHPGARCLVTVGCGGDINPAPRGALELAQRHGEELAREATRVLGLGPGSGLVAVHGEAVARLASATLPFAPARSRAEWEERAASGGAIAYHARKNLARLDRGETLPTEVALPVQVLTFGADLAWVFLGGEVTVDYALRLKRELDPERLAVSAYSNDVPCYIPSERVLAEGGYEAEGAMVYYDRPHRFATGVEERVIAKVRELVPETFRFGPGHDARWTEGSAPRDPEPSRRAMRFAPHLGSELEVRLAACEPLVVDPIAIDFGPDGRLWVCEMGDYPQGRDGRYAPGGRIKVLEDVDGDFVYDNATVFLDGLPFPTDVKVWRDGVLICAAPDIKFARDADGDGAADDVRTLFTGFATENYQARVNSLRVGLDGWIYGANGLLGGTITSFTGDTLELGTRDFRIDPERGKIEPVSGLTQQGRARDEFGAWFGCDNSTLAWHYPVPPELAVGAFASLTRARTSVARGDDPNRLFPISATAERFNDSAHHGRVTSACGLEIYRDLALGQELRGNLFVCEPVHNLVHRLVLERDGLTVSGRRAAGEERAEFLASKDPWFRPVQVKTGLDGALWIVDMYRYVIEHPRWIPEQTQASLDLRAGDELGRIWRVVRSAGMPERPVRTDGLRGSEFVTALDTPNGPTRDLIQERIAELDAASKHRGPHAQDLVWLFETAEDPAVRAQVFATLAQREQHPARLVARVANAAAPELRVLAMNELYRRGTELDDDAIAGLADSDLRVALAAALAIGRRHGTTRELIEALAELMRREGDELLLVAAALAAAPRDEPRLDLFQCYARSAAGPPLPSGVALLTELALDAEGRRATFAALEGLGILLDHALYGPGVDPRLRLANLAAFFGALDRRGESVWELEGRAPFRLRAALTSAQRAIDEARAVAADPAVDLTTRLGATALLARNDGDRSGDARALAALFTPTEDATLRRAAVVALVRGADESCLGELFDAWPSFGPTLHTAALDEVLTHAVSTRAFLAWAAIEPARARSVDAAHRQRLLAHPDPELRARAEALFASTPTPGAATELARFADVDRHLGDAPRGREVFTRLCQSCHVLDGVGTATGPDLDALTDRSTEGLLAAILDPNRAVLAGYLEYVAVDDEGRVHGGIVVEEGATHVRLRGQSGEERVLARGDLVELANTGRSFMPEGLGVDLDPVGMADLLAFLRAPRVEPKAFAGNEPVPIHVDANGEWDLSAGAAQIYGDELVFEAPLENLGYWHGPSDRALWTVVAETSADVDVWIEWACDDASAGETFELTGAGATIRGIVDGTGAGWSTYRWRKVGELALPGGRHAFEAHAVGDPARSLFDLRRFVFTPRGESPSDAN